ncbi:Uncharacterised protein [Mycobacteroides abscessus subsp. abscessus]|nr:Uncharacterised protein [Mycobacteroides abscessus subsp. abscessus]
MPGAWSSSWRWEKRSRSMPQDTARMGEVNPFCVRRSAASWVGTVMKSADWNFRRRSHQAMAVPPSTRGLGTRR